MAREAQPAVEVVLDPLDDRVHKPPGILKVEPEELECITKSCIWALEEDLFELELRMIRKYYI